MSSLCAGHAFDTAHNSVTDVTTTLRSQSLQCYNRLSTHEVRITQHLLFCLYRTVPLTLTSYTCQRKLAHANIICNVSNIVSLTAFRSKLKKHTDVTQNVAIILAIKV